MRQILFSLGLISALIMTSSALPFASDDSSAGLGTGMSREEGVTSSEETGNGGHAYYPSYPGR